MYETSGHFDVLNFPHVDLGSTRLMRVVIDASGPFTPSRHSLLEATLLVFPFAFASRIVPKRRDLDIDRNPPTRVNASSRLRPPQTEKK